MDKRRRRKFEGAAELGMGWVGGWVGGGGWVDCFTCRTEKWSIRGRRMLVAWST